MDPDELYTLRAQYWLGHYNLCLEEAKSVARRPMAANLKLEREEFVLRCQLALKQFDKVLVDSAGEDRTPGIQAINLRAQYESPSATPSTKSQILTSLHTLLSSPTGSTSTTLQLLASQTFLSAGSSHTESALECVHLGTTMEHLAQTVQIYLKMNRIDLASRQFDLMKQADEEAVLTQLCGVYVNAATGRSEVNEAVHVLGSLTEQYGPSLMLLNCMAVVMLVGERYDEAETVLVQAVGELDQQGVEGGKGDVDTLINLLVCYQHQGKEMDVIDPVLKQLKEGWKDHPFVEGLLRVEGAFDREAVKYAVSS